MRCPKCQRALERTYKRESYREGWGCRGYEYTINDYCCRLCKIVVRIYDDDAAATLLGPIWVPEKRPALLVVDDPIVPETKERRGKLKYWADKCDIKPPRPTPIPAAFFALSREIP